MKLSDKWSQVLKDDMTELMKKTYANLPPQIDSYWHEGNESSAYRENGFVSWLREWRLRLSYAWDALCGRYYDD